MSEYIITTHDEPDVDGSYRLTKPAEEVVRCRDCKHYDERDAGCSYFVLAKSKLLHIKDPDGFCAWGERRGV